MLSRSYEMDAGARYRCIKATSIVFRVLQDDLFYSTTLIDQNTIFNEQSSV